MANAGIGMPLAGGTAPYYIANNPAELSTALGDIIGGIRSCVITVEGGQVDLSRADEGIVILNGTPLQFGTDWQMNDPTTLELLGAACDMYLNTPDVTLEADFPCGVIIP
jgi:hypothetical protein